MNKGNNSFTPFQFKTIKLTRNAKSVFSNIIKAIVTYTHLLGRMLIGLISERDLTFWQVDPNRTANHEAAL